MDMELLFSLKLSLYVSLVSTLFVTLIGGVLGYFLATRHFPGKIFLEIFLSLPLILPPTVTGFYLILLFGRQGLIGAPLFHLTGWTLMFTPWACMLASFTVSLPLMVRATMAAIGSVDKTMIESAYTLGYSEWETALKVTLPLAKKGLIAGISLSFARSLGEFGATLMLAGNIPGKTDTVPLLIYSFSSTGEWNRVNLLVFFLTLISAFFLYWSNRYGKGNGVI